MAIDPDPHSDMTCSLLDGVFDALQTPKIENSSSSH